MNIINFINRFPDEASCIDFIKEQRSQQGIICKKCTGSDIIGWIASILFNAPAVGLEQISEVVLLWKTATYRLESG